MENALRPFWLPGINNVTGVPEVGFAQWLREPRSSYGVNAITPGAFSITLVPASTWIEAYAHDAARMGVASMESMALIPGTLRLPKASAWYAIQAYYSAFFAAHYILRVFGINVTKLDSKCCDRLRDIALALGLIPAGSVGMAPGLYSCSYDPATSVLSGTLLPGGVSHRAMWGVFTSRMKGRARFSKNVCWPFIECDYSFG